MSDSNNNNNNNYGTPNKKKRNELLDASLLSPHHVTSVMGTGVNLASPEMNNFMSVFMSPTLTTSQYNPNVPDSKDWTPGIQNKLPNDGFLTFPDTVTPGILAQNNNSIHVSRTSFSNLRPLNNNSINNNSSSGNAVNSNNNTNNATSNNNSLPSGGLSLSNLGSGIHNAGLLGAGLLSVTQNQLHGGLGISGSHALASPSLMSPLFPDLLDITNTKTHPLSAVGNNEDLFFGVQPGSMLHHNHNSNSSNNSNHFAQNAEALKNRLNKRKSSSETSSQMSEGTSLFSQATGHVSQHNASHILPHKNHNINTDNNNMLPLSQSEHSQLSVSSDISGIAAITAAAAFMPPSSAQNKIANIHNNSNKKKPSAKKMDSRMEEDVNNNQNEEEEDGEDDEVEEEENNNNHIGQANRSFMSPEMRELSMRSITPKSAQHNYNNTNSHTIVCNCKKSKCLKMYCDCFRLSEYCKAGCNCVECCNIEKFDSLRLSARKSIQDRNPEAFKPRVKEEQKEHLTGCHCRKSACLKKYCECYTGKVPCSIRCRCVDCQNVPSLYSNKQFINDSNNAKTATYHGANTANNNTKQTPATVLPRSGTSGFVTMPSSNIKCTTSTKNSSLINNIPYIHTTTNNNSQPNSAEKDLQSTSPSAAVAVLQTLSASKAFNTRSFLSNADTGNKDSESFTKPVKLFVDEDDDFNKSHVNNNIQNDNNSNNSNSNDVLRIDITTDKVHLQSLAPHTHSINTTVHSNGNDHAYREVCPSSDMDSTTSLLPPRTGTTVANHNDIHTTSNAAVCDTFSIPQSPIRPTATNNNNNNNWGTLSAVMSPQKLLELAEWCEERQPSREIVYPLPQEKSTKDTP